MDSPLHSVQSLLLLGLVASAMVIAAVRLLRPNASHWPRWMRFGWLSDVLLSADTHQKAWGRRFAVAVANCLAGVLALNVGAAYGLIAAGPCRQLTIAALLTVAGFYTLMRSGINQRLRDPTMVEPQIWATIGFLAWGYLIGGPGRPVALLLLVAILAFNLPTMAYGQMVRQCLLAALLFGVVMWRTAAQGNPASPGNHTGVVQWVIYCVLLLVLVTLCLLVAQMNRLRHASMSHQSELRAALTRIQELATQDDLTGLFNRRHMLERLHTERHRCIRSGRRFGLAMIDIDHFKRVNDQFGHGAGDHVLAKVASTIAAGLRETDVVARWGGEEFLVMFTDTDVETAERVLSRIQLALQHTTVSEAASMLRVTFSAGVTGYQPDEVLTRTIDRADRALYRAKAAGRACVVSDPPAGQAQPQAMA